MDYMAIRAGGSTVGQDERAAVRSAPSLIPQCSWKLFYSLSWKSFIVSLVWLNYGQVYFY